MIKELEKEFIGKGQVRGFKFTQIKKNEHAYIYKVNQDGVIRYEVFQRRVNTRFNCITYPSNRAFGVWAKTTRSLSGANVHFEHFTNIKEMQDNG